MGPGGCAAAVKCAAAVNCAATAAAAAAVLLLLINIYLIRTHARTTDCSRCANNSCISHTDHQPMLLLLNFVSEQVPFCVYAVTYIVLCNNAVLFVLSTSLITIVVYQGLGRAATSCSK